MKIDLVKLVEEVYKLEGEPKNVNKVFALICLQAFKEQLTLTDVGCSLDFDKLRKQFDDILDTFDKQKIQDWLDKKS